MTLEPADTNEQEIEDLVLNLLPEDGTYRAAASIARELSKSTIEVYRILSDICAKGLAQARRGRAGGFARLIQQSDTPDATLSPKIAEPAYYDSIMQELKDWYDGMGWGSTVIKTAQSGSRPTGGRWTRPDLFSVVKQSIVFYHKNIVDYVSYEVKFSETLDTLAVYEALNHSRSASLSYLLLIGLIPVNKQDVFDDVQIICQKHGIGLVVMPIDTAGERKVLSTDSWIWHLEPLRNVVDPKRIDDFIKTQVPPDKHEEVLKIVK